MNEQKRFFVFLMVSFLTMFGLQLVLEQAGFFPKPQDVAKQKAGETPKAGDVPKAALVSKDGEAKKAETPKAAGEMRPAPKQAVAEETLELGSTSVDSGFRMRLVLSNRGAALISTESATFDADHLPGQDSKEKLRLVKSETGAPESLSLEIRTVDGEDKSIDLGEVNWEVVRGNPQAGVVTEADGSQRVEFRYQPPEVPGLKVTKVFKLAKDRNDVGLSIRLESDIEQSVSYLLVGPYGLPLEGEWYSYTYRDLFFAPVDPRANLISRSSAEVAKSANPESGYPPEVVTIPIRFAGVETQYFANFVEIRDGSGGLESNWIAQASERLVGPIPQDSNKANITVSLTTKPVKLGPSESVTHEYAVYMGPKIKQVLMPYKAEELTTYRKGWAVPGSRLLARSFISPLLDLTYNATKKFFGIFGARRGSYGLAIILLTAVVRLMIFPLSRKQAITAKRMQELQPQMMAIKEKFKDDKERQGRETMELYKQAGVNPFSGCLIAMIQLPIFMGLWQTLNNSVALRHAPFLYIDNLAAPDALFRFPSTIPFLGDYFNLLPILSVVLMYLQMKLFSPPPANEEAEMQQRMFSVMMVFMSFMFYKVPSGLGLYFITSSLWAVGERLLLPKLVSPGAELALPSSGGSVSSSGSGNRSSSSAKPEPTGWRAKWQKLLEEAEKQRTIQNENRKKNSGKQQGGKDRPKKGGR